MKILFITDNFPPETNAPATRTLEHCKKWVDLGAEVTIITCVPNFPAGKVYDGYSNKLFQREQIDGIEVLRVWSYITSNKGVIKRVLDYFSFSFMAFWVGLFQKFDVVIATSPQFFTTWSAFGLSCLKRKPWVFELRDLWPASIAAVGAIKNKTILKMLEWIELFLYKNAHLIVANTPAFKQNLIARGIDEQKIEVIVNGVDTNLFHPQLEDNSAFSHFNGNGEFVVGYIGTHGMAHGLDFILNAIAALDNNEFHFLFIGDGAEKANLKKQANELELSNVTFLDAVAKEQVPKCLASIDVSLVPLKKADTFKKVIPSKIFEAAAMKKPILLGVEGQAKQIIEEYRIGLCFEPESKTEFLDKLRILNKNKKLYNKLSRNGRSLVEVYNRDILAKRMHRSIQNLSNLA